MEPSRKNLDPDIYILDIGFLFCSMRVQIIKCTRIVLRPLSIKDAPIFRSWLNNKEVTKNLIVQKAPSLVEEIKWIKDQIKSKENHVWSILDEYKKLIGNIHLRYDSKNSIGHFGIVIGEKTAWGKGYGKEAFEAVINFAFNKLKCNRLELFVFSKNERAKKLYKKLGFVYEGRQRQKHYNLITKKFEDDEVYSILRREYKK